MTDDDDHPFASGIKKLMRENRDSIRVEHRGPLKQRHEYDDYPRPDNQCRKNPASDYYETPSDPSLPLLTLLLALIAISSIVIPLVVALYA